MCGCVCVLCTIFTVVADGDSVRRRLFHKGGLTVRTVTNVDRGGETVVGTQKQKSDLNTHRKMC